MATKLRTPYNQIVSPNGAFGLQIPVTSPIDTTQVKNPSGGYVYEIEPMKQLERFLVLGTVGGTYYASEAKLTKDNADVVQKLIDTDGPAVVTKVVQMVTENRVPKMDPPLFVLAVAASTGNPATKRAVREALPKVARIGTHIFTFVEFAQQFRGWGRSLREMVAAWYTTKVPSSLAYQVIKYQQRNGWSHRDLLRLSHAKTTDSSLNDVLHWIVKGWTEEEFRGFSDANMHKMQED